MVESRPALGEHLSGQELLRWYWLHDELTDFARTLGVSGRGGKQAVTARLVAHLDGRPLPPDTATPRRSAAALPEPLTATTVIPDGQRCTQQLRRYLTEAVGPAFVFDAAMRDFIATGTGRTLGAAVDHWYATRSRPAPDIGDQFELNAFVRRWHLQHPGRSRVDALDAWWCHRRLPAEARHLVDEGGPPGASARSSGVTRA